MTDRSLPPAPDAAGTPASPPTDTARHGVSLRFSARDLLSVAIFAVIYFVVVYAIAMLGIISPLVMAITLPLAAIAAGIPFMLFLTRVRHAGMVTLFGVVVALMYFVGGQPWTSLVVTIVVSVLAEVVLWLGRYRSRWAAIWTYTVFSLWFIGPMLPLLLDREEYLSAPGMQTMGPEYAEQFDQFFSVTVVWAFNAGALVCGFLGGLLGSALLRKHFRRAGLA